MFYTIVINSNETLARVVLININNGSEKYREKIYDEQVQWFKVTTATVNIAGHHNSLVSLTEVT